MSAHLFGQVPPQSTSVSGPFFTVSVQIGAEHFLVTPSQTPLVQSAVVAQVFPSAHFAQLPPQSTSVSDPFFELSPQAAARHLLPLQTAVVVIDAGAG